MGLDHGFRSADGDDIIVLRKANHIHNWMCNNTVYNDSGYNGGMVVIAVEDIIKLIETMKMVLDNHDLASELLPRVDGFFFGSQEYDEWYFDDTKNTLEALSNFLESNPDTKTVKYWAWW